MKKRICQLIAFVLVAALCSACSGGFSSSASNSRPSLTTDFTREENPYTFGGQPSQNLRLSGEGVDAILAAVAQTQPDYTQEALYELEEVKSRLDFDASVENHSYSALTPEGTLTGSYLASLVKANNDAFLATEPFGYQAVEESYLRQLCDFIVQIVSLMREKYPDIDWPRVYCNLGNLKILYDTGMLSFAEVSQEMILSISKNNTQIILNMKGEDGFTRVLTHETMHIIQIGCACEKIENCGRRAGIAVYWDDFPLNTADWTWMVEGSAERHMCQITGGEAVSYQYKMDYLCSLTMSVLLRDSVETDTIDTLCFYDDPQRLFDSFGCQTQQEKDELLKMMITLQVLQMQPENFHIRYTEKTGVDLKADAEATDQFSYSLKPAICITLAKEFYENLAAHLRENEISCNDLFFLLNLFEGHLNQHLGLTVERKAQFNQPFMDAYSNLRSALFAALEQENPDLDLISLYEAYEITAGENLLNATLEWLPEEKREFLAERAQWQADNLGLGVKAP